MSKFTEIFKAMATVNAAVITALGVILVAFFNQYMIDPSTLIDKFFTGVGLSLFLSILGSMTLSSFFKSKRGKKFY